MIVAFGPFILDIGARQLARGSEAIHLSPKALALLMLLVEKRPAAVAKNEIHQRLWPDTFVADINVPVLVAELRAALGDTSKHPQFIRTVNRFGYAFAGTAADIERPKGDLRNVGTCWLSWSERRAQLAAGENVLGRDRRSDVCIDSAGVSRQHAVITVGNDAVTVRDLASKNGTYVGDRRVTGPVALVDGMQIQLGPIAVVFHTADAALSTQTVAFSRRASRSPA